MGQSLSKIYVHLVFGTKKVHSLAFKSYDKITHDI
jgi:hypothetical protein